MSTLDEARNEMDFVSAQEVLSENFTLEVLEALNVCVRGVARAVAEDVYAGKEAERRQKLDDLKRSIGVPVYDEDYSEPFKPGEDHSYYGGPGYENATAEQCANLDRRFTAATSPTDTGALVARVIDSARYAVKLGVSIQSDASDVLAALEAMERRIGELEAALQPFANAVFNDNGDVTYDYTHFGIEDLFRAYSVMKRVRPPLSTTGRGSE